MDFVALIVMLIIVPSMQYMHAEWAVVVVCAAAILVVACDSVRIRLNRKNTKEG